MTKLQIEITFKMSLKDKFESGLDFTIILNFFHSAYSRIAHTKLLIYPLSIPPSKVHTRFFKEDA
jgi:hypothetical protein